VENVVVNLYDIRSNELNSTGKGVLPFFCVEGDVLKRRRCCVRSSLVRPAQLRESEALPSPDTTITSIS
jgi:hypothetical protein